MSRAGGVEDPRLPRYGLFNRARRTFTGVDPNESIDRLQWDEGEAPADGQYAEPAPANGVQVATAAETETGNVAATMFWWIWENWCGFTGYLSRQNAFGDFGLRMTAYMMAVTDVFEAFFSMIGRIIRLLWELIVWFWVAMFRITWVAGIPIPIIFWYLIGLLLLYLLNAYWQLVLVVTLDVIVPILNLLITLLNFLTLLITLLLRIVFQIWNIFVPFIGMFIYIILDLVVTILQIVFDILQSDGLMNILQALFEIIFFLVDICMQILMVFLQLGMPILQILAELLSFILELIFVVIEIVLEILVWILDLLFKILEPILLIIQALCAAFSWMVAASSSFRMGRSLLSVNDSESSSSLRFDPAIFRQGSTRAQSQPMSDWSILPPEETPTGPTDYYDFVSSTYAQYARHVVHNTSSPHLSGDAQQLREEYAQLWQDIDVDENPDDWFASSANPTMTPMDSIRRDIALRAARNRATQLPENFGQSLSYLQQQQASTDEALTMSAARRLLEVRRLEERRDVIGRGLGDDFSAYAAEASSQSRAKRTPSTAKEGASPKQPAAPDASKLDKTSELFMSQFHTGVQQMVNEPTTNMDLMHHTLGRVREHQRRGHDDLAIQSIMQRAAREHPELAGAPPGPAWVRYREGPEHPHVTHMRLQNERHDFADSRGIPRSYRAYQEKLVEQRRRGQHANPASSTARQLLENRHPDTGAHTWMGDSHHQAANHLRTMEIQHAQQIREQHNEYMNYHYNHVVMSKTLMHGLRGRVLYHAQNTLHFDNLSDHMQRILERFGYRSVKEAYHDFLNTHGSAENFVLSLAYISEMPGIAFFKQYDERRDTHPFFLDWHRSQQEEDRLRERVYGKAPAGSRKLLRTQPSEEDAESAARINGDKEPAGRGSSKEKFEGLEIIASTDCFSAPRNPLCMPEIPADLGEKLQIGEIEVDDRIKEDSDLCDPWQPDTNLIGWQRIVNGWHSIRFLISGFPPFNFLLTTFTLLVPWLAWTVDWVFLVDKGDYASFEQIFCFFISLYDLILFILFVRLIWWTLRFLGRTLGKFVLDLWGARQRQVEFKQKLIEQRTNDPLLEQQFRAYTLLERERELLDRTEVSEAEREDQERRADELGAPLIQQQFIQMNMNGHFDSHHPYARHCAHHIHRVTQSVQSKERHAELFQYYSLLLRMAFDLDHQNHTNVNRVAVAASWRRMCQRYPEFLASDELPGIDEVVISADQYHTSSLFNNGYEDDGAASSNGTTTTNDIGITSSMLLPYMHPPSEEKDR